MKELTLIDYLELVHDNNKPEKETINTEEDD